MIPIYVVDAFTDEPFRGNPAGVVTLGANDALTEHQMQSLAAEMKHAETAFLTPRGSDWGLRWFTPTTEVDLCGHATLASAFVLWNAGLAPETGRITFQTRSGPLLASRAGQFIELDFPAEPPTMAGAEVEERVQAALGKAKASWVGSNRMDAMAILDSERAVRELHPDIEAIERLDFRGLIVTAQSDSSQYDFVSRFFAPGAGVVEDDATGSAHCALGPYWAEVLGKADLKAYQASPRGAEIGVRVAGPRVHLLGKAALVLEGALTCFGS
jgi:PhzF family phenazine biosynthesis protein